ncbi:MAG TPA: ATP-dependent sacrificial sulfur transferase LarE [Thermomonospora sp.]|nr:ATP-dependent sacrificial sulfur transferase LarE [Thermomonospora sp.]
MAGRKLVELRRLLAGLPGAVVAYSGGVDSTLLAYLAHEELGERALAVTADSASLPRAELAAACDMAARFGMRHRLVATDELGDDRYVRNGADRCRFCKEALLTVLSALARADGARGREILLGVNVDDLADHRPGQAAARARGARFPMVEAGLGKAEVRWAARELGLPAWDKPSAACLASRVAYGVPVTAEGLRRIEHAEEALRRLGFDGQVRVRDQGRDLARIELDRHALPRAVALAAEIVAGVRDAGFRYVTLDLEAYRQGSHNAALGLPVVRA